MRNIDNGEGRWGDDDRGGGWKRMIEEGDRDGWERAGGYRGQQGAGYYWGYQHLPPTITINTTPTIIEISLQKILITKLETHHFPVKQNQDFPHKFFKIHFGCIPQKQSPINFSPSLYPYENLSNH